MHWLRGGDDDDDDDDTVMIVSIDMRIFKRMTNLFIERDSFLQLTQSSASLSSV
jgi:hypothetical protein